MISATSDRWLCRSLILSAIVHCAVALWHGAAHVHVPVPLTPAQTAFVAIVIIAMPFVGLGLLWTRRKGLGAWIIATSLLASLLFGLLNHFVLDSPDYVMAVPEHEWRHSFVLSAALVAITEAIGTVLGVVAAIRWQESAAGN